MTQEKQETRQEEVARVRSYLSSQAIRRTPEQLVETLREAHQQFLVATATVPDALFHTPPQEGEWSAADVVAHVRRMADFDARSISGVIERGELPVSIADTLEHAPKHATREQMLAEIAELRQRLIAVVLQADPDIHLDILWGHTEFGKVK